MPAEEGTGLISELDSLEVVKGPERLTCQWWRQQSPETLEAVVRAVQRVGHTAVARHLRATSNRVTPPDLKLHAEGRCDKCR